ncbi:transglycosylase SLT domain-containing protein [Sphingomonas sp. S1-29]|uniref:transglycosylase SLT domain-containing protein n=1 Tax=Sphingomonas sp. S1-29 TaxID=2991074 RepID=UPI00223F013A|nr:transglycosylase SLT domain-containing protein [Sphingomonas sp. S1-29]UZK69603.1 transglycosylase SLT domain-containing protein [Sphingomonas sp. S1-29]
MSDFNIFRDGGNTLLAGINSDPFREGVQQRRVDQADQLKREQVAYEMDRQRTYHTKLAEAMTANDPDRAAMLAYQYGDEKTGTGIGKVRQEQFTRAQGTNTTMANIVAGVARLPYEQRRAAIMSAAPMLTSMGRSAEEISAFDPTDENLAAVAGVDYTLKDRDANDVSVFEANTGRQTADTNRMVAENPQVVGQSLVTRDGKELFRSPDMKGFGMDQNVYEIPGTTSDGYTTTTTSSTGGTGQMSGLAGSNDPTFSAMVGAESNYRQTDRQGRPLTSSAGAMGIAQVMPGTAREMAQEMGIQFDEQRYRTDPKYNSALGYRYYTKMLQQFGGDRTKAVAAYNAGPGGVNRAMARATRAGNPDAWGQYLPAETRDYVQKVTRTTRQSQVQGQQQTTRNPRMIQQGVARPTRGGVAQDGGKPLPKNYADMFSQAAGTYRGFDASINSFKPGYGGNLVGGLENTAQGILGDRVGTQGQRDWWAAHYANDNVERHAIFGAALTSTEKQAWTNTTISPAMDDQQILTNLRRRRSVVQAVLKRQRNFLLAQGYSPAAIAALSEGL